jgi:uncharacterized membrane protein
MILVGAVLAIVGYVVLPDLLVMQWGVAATAEGGASPKLAALAIPFLICLAGALGYMFYEEKKNLLFISGLGIFVLVLDWVFNLPRVF